MLFHIRPGRKNEVQHKGDVEKAKRVNLASVQNSTARRKGHGKKQRLQTARRKNGHLRAAEAGVERLLRQTMGAARRNTHWTNRISHLVHISRWKSGVLRHNQQFFTHKASLGPVVQIVENGLIRFGKRSFNVVNFQRPDWICGSFHTTFKVARLVQIPNIHNRGELFFPLPNRPRIRCRCICSNIFLFDGNGRFHTNQPRDFVVQSSHNFRKPFNPRHDGGELHVAHCTAAGVTSKILFHNLFGDPADAGGQTGESSSIHDGFNKLVV